jgi:hypothetical protein
MNNIWKNIESVLLNNTLRWVLFLIVLILNFVAFVQDPIRLCKVDCFGIPCKWFGYLAGMGTYTMDCLTFIGLWLTIPFTIALPEYWFIPFIIIGYTIITQITVSSKTYGKDGEKESSTLNPPPGYLWSKNKRVIIYSLILIFDTIIFLQFYLASNTTKLTGNVRLLDVLFLNKFGGYSGNEISFIMAWIGVIGLLFDIIAYRLSSSYYSCKYDHPISWDY